MAPPTTGKAFSSNIWHLTRHSESIIYPKPWDKNYADELK